MHFQAKTKWILLSISFLVGLMGVAGAVALNSRKTGVKSVSMRVVSKKELSESDGKNGHVCLVAVDGIVYKIEGFSLWQNGKHLTSEGRAYCGADLSKVIDQAPHGRKKLDLLQKIGTLDS